MVSNRASLRVFLKSSAALRIAVAVMACLATTVAAPQENGVLARVNGADITSADVAFASRMWGARLGDLPDDAKTSVLVNALIEVRLVAQAAKAANVPESEAYKQQIAFLEAQTLRSVYVDGKIAERVTDEAVRKAYDEQVAKIPAVEEYRASHILVASLQDANDVVGALKDGEDFAQLAKERSLDEVSREKGGDLGFIGSGEMIEEFEKAAASLKPGEYAAVPIKTAFGFHVVKLVERRPRPAPSYDDLSGQIRASLEASTTRDVLEDLRAKAKVEKFIPDVPLEQNHASHPAQ